MYFARTGQNGELCRKGARTASPTDPFWASRVHGSAEWRLQWPLLLHARFAPKHQTCSCYGKQQADDILDEAQLCFTLMLLEVAWIRHHRKPVGDGIFNCMEIHVLASAAAAGRCSCLSSHRFRDCIRMAAELLTAQRSIL